MLVQVEMMMLAHAGICMRLGLNGEMGRYRGVVEYVVGEWWRGTGVSVVLLKLSLGDSIFPLVYDLIFE